MQDTQIIKLFFERKEKAIEETQKKYGRYCFTVAHNILSNDADSEECVNDTLLRAWKSIPPQKPHNLCTYLGKITRNLALNRYKSYTAEKRGKGQMNLILNELENCLPSENSTEKSFDESFLTKTIEEYLKTEPKEKRIIFLRRYWYGCSIKEIAKDFSLSESKVTSILFRMRQKLKTHLEKEGIFI